jgi:hypothetical protein
MRLLAVLAAATALLLAACNGGKAAPPPDGDGDGAPEAVNDRPPAAFAQAGGDEVPLGLGSFCWAMLCVDTIGVITVDEVLEVRSGERVEVSGPLMQAPVAGIGATAWPRPDAPVDSGTWGMAWQPDGEEHVLDFDGTGFAADLPPGDYIVALFVRFERGDAMYGLQLAVR